MEIIEGENEAVAVDSLIDNFVHGNMSGALRDLHEPSNADRAESDAAPSTD